MPFFKNLIQDAAKVAETAAPIVGGAIGGPAGAALGAGASKLVKTAASTRALGGQGIHAHPGAPSFTPSSSGDLAEARGQDKKRMSDQYGIEY